MAASSSRYSCKNNSTSEIDWRTAADFRGGGGGGGGGGGVSSGCAKTKSKMSDLNIQRGHSPHFSPSRNNCKL